MRTLPIHYSLHNLHVSYHSLHYHDNFQLDPIPNLILILLIVPEAHEFAQSLSLRVSGILLVVLK
jgi:hypothetical protein